MSPAQLRVHDWTTLAKGCRRRSWEYLNWCLDDAKNGRLVRAYHYHKRARQSRLTAWDAITRGKRERNLA